MTLSIEELDALPASDAIAFFTTCCGSSGWASAMVRRRPFRTRETLLRAAREAWKDLSPSDWLEAFAHHPRIGETHAAAVMDSAALQWSEREQSSAAAADGRVKQELVRAQQEYERRFGFIFLICASGKTADEILAALRARLRNHRHTELRVAAHEQWQITRLRLASSVTSGSATSA